MTRVNTVLEFVLIVAVLGLGLVVWRADQHAQAADRELACLQRAQATATVALLTPEASIDEEGRLRAIELLGQRLDAC